MTVNGHVENGNIVLDEAVSLSNGVKVRVEVLASEGAQATNEEQVPTLNERYKSIIGSVKDLPSDFAKNHDHYIHGQPKK